VQAADLSLVRDGAQLLPGLALPLLGELSALAERMPRDRAGTRIAGDSGAAEMLASPGPVCAAVEALGAATFRPVRAVLFDKNGGLNWSLGWHQDRTISVRARREAAGFGPWTVKQGIPHVEPPFAVIERMITVRIHLDPVDADNAPLLIAPGSHRSGRIPVDDLRTAVESGTIFACLADAGDVWAYSTPILHASHAASPGRRRRVLQADYSADQLPDGLEWFGL